MRYLAMTLGVVTAIGGFLDIGEFVSLPQAGASFGLALLPIVLLGTIGAMVYAEMAGRIELASRRTVFDLIRKRLGLRVGLVALAAALALNVLTLVAEIGGMAFVAELVLGRRFLWYVVPLAIVLALFIWRGSWSWQENLPSILGLATLVIPAALLFGNVPVSWSVVGRSLVAPSVPSADYALLATAAIAVLGAGMSPYEWYFYSSGAREDGWTRHDQAVNRVTAIGGFALGSLLSIALLILAATVFLPAGLNPNHLAQTGLLVGGSFGSWGIAIFLVGVFGCVLGASIETSVSSAQTVAEFFGWRWGSSRPVRDARGARGSRSTWVRATPGSAERCPAPHVFLHSRKCPCHRLARAADPDRDARGLRSARAMPGHVRQSGRVRGGSVVLQGRCCRGARRDGSRSGRVAQTVDCEQPAIAEVVELLGERRGVDVGDLGEDLVVERIVEQ